MGGFSLLHWLIVLIVVLVFFGSGRAPKAMSDLGKGLRSLREGLSAKDEKKDECEKK